MNHADPFGNCIKRTCYFNLLFTDKNISALLVFHSKQYFHQCGLPCSVLTDQTVNFSLINRKGYILVGYKSVWINFSDVIHSEHFHILRTPSHEEEQPGPAALPVCMINQSLPLTEQTY